MKKISFTKMSGAGNDFILLDKANYPDLILNSIFIKKICNRRKGIGADGVITIAADKKYSFNMEYFNADGSTGSLCGNGARCAVKFAYESGIINGSKSFFLSNGKVYSGEIIGNEVKFYLNQPFDLKTDIKIDVNGRQLNASYVNTGSPHVVIFIENIGFEKSETGINGIPVVQIGREIRYNPSFPEGTNVNFITFLNNKIYIRTYERGVENETLACGTGAAAAAVISYLKHTVKPPVILKTKGGDELTVDFIEDGLFTELSLAGPAVSVYQGELELNKFI